MSFFSILRTHLKYCSSENSNFTLAYMKKNESSEVNLHFTSRDAE